MCKTHARILNLSIFFGDISADTEGSVETLITIQGNNGGFSKKNKERNENFPVRIFSITIWTIKVVSKFNSTAFEESE